MEAQAESAGRIRFAQRKGPRHALRGGAESGELTGPPSFFDSHCHLTEERLRGDVDEILERARASSVTRVVSIASDAQDAARALDLARSHPGVFSTAGIHPHVADEASDEALGRVAALLDEPEVVAVGETGLDYHYDNAPRAAQRRAFEAHMKLAGDASLPAVVHCRSADEDTAAVIRDFAPDVRGVLHCFAGEARLLEAGLVAGWWVSFSGLVTFPNFPPRDLLSVVPGDRLLIETDSPYLAPVPHRGKRNEPAYVVEVARAVAAELGVDIDAVARQTTRNACEFYGLRA